MSEYTFVEKPLLNQLASMGWQVIDQGEGVPKDSTVSLRSSFREVVLRDVLASTGILLVIHMPGASDAIPITHFV